MTSDYRHPRRSIDGMLPVGDTKRRPHIIRHRSEPVQLAKPQPERYHGQQAHAEPPKPLWRRALHLINHTLLFIALLILGILIQSALVGQLVIFLYALTAFVFKISSRLTFFLVLGCFMVVLFASARSDTTLAATFAMYAFLLLVIGTISLAREVRNEV